MMNTCCNNVYKWNTSDGQLQKPNSTFQTQRLQEFNHVIIITTSCNQNNNS